MTSGEVAQVEETSREAQRFLCRAIISQMLVSRDILDTGRWILSAGFEHQVSSISDRLLSQIKEEISEAYKDVADVVDVVCGAEIAKKVAKLIPIGVIKG